MNDYYTYIYLDPRRTGLWETSDVTLLYEPFYVGKGRGRRIFSHLTSKKKSHKNNRIADIRQSGHEPITIKLHIDIAEQQALDYESLLIKEIGTRAHIPGVPTGPLTNLKLDGRCQIYSLESREKISLLATIRVRNPHTEATKEKMRLFHQNMSPDKRAQKAAKLSAIHRGKKLSADQCERLSKLHKGKPISAEHRARISELRTGTKRPDHIKDQISKRQQKTWNILIESTGGTFSVVDLRNWCIEQNISYHTLHGTQRRDKFHKGYKIIGCSGGTHNVNSPSTPAL